MAAGRTSAAEFGRDAKRTVDKKLSKDLAYYGTDSPFREKDKEANAAELAKHIKPGVTTKELDRIADEFIRDNGAVPTFQGFPNPYGNPFPASICTSVNDVVVHGIPDEKTVLRDGDIISIDCGR